MSEDPRRQLRRLYRGVDGFEIPHEDSRNIRRSRGSPIYGELMPTASLRLLEQLRLGPQDQFHDLGAGIGKLVLLAAMTTPVRRAVGTELSRSRVALGQRVLAAARREDLPGAERAELHHGDMLKVDLSDATVIYSCSTAFSGAFMRRLLARLVALPRLRLFVSLRDLDPHPAFPLVGVHRLDTSWQRRTPVYVHARARAR